MTKLDRLRAEQKQLTSQLRGRRSTTDVRRIQARLAEVLRQIRDEEKVGGSGTLAEPPPSPKAEAEAAAASDLKAQKPVRKRVKLADEPSYADDPWRSTPERLLDESVSSPAQSHWEGLLVAAFMILAWLLALVMFIGMGRCQAATGTTDCKNNTFLVGLGLRDPARLYVPMEPRYRRTP